MLGEGVVSDGLIDPSEIPGKTIDVAGIEAAASDLATAATAVATAGGSVVTGWSSLPAVYVAPEAQQLYDVMSPVTTDTAALETTLTSAADAISTLAVEVQEILSKLDTIRADASEFVVEARKGYTVDFWDPNHPNWDNGWLVGLTTDFADMKSAHLRWDQYDPAVERNKELIALVDAQVIALSEAEATCVDAINALRDDTCLPQSTPLTQQDLDAAGDRPWGDPDARDRSCYEATNDTIESGVTSFASGFGRAATDTVVGLATLFGVDTDALGADPVGYLAAQVGYDTQTGEWSEELRDESAAASTELSNRTLGEAAASLGAIALIGPVVPLLASTSGPLGDAAKAVWQKQQDVIAGIVGTPEQWQDNPAEAAGALTFNVGSAFIPVAGAAGKAGTLGTVARTALSDAGDLTRTAISETSTLAHKATNATRSGLDSLLHGNRTPTTPHTVHGETGATNPTRVGVTTGTVDELEGRLPAAHHANGDSNTLTGTGNDHSTTVPSRDGGNDLHPAADSTPGHQADPDADTSTGPDTSEAPAPDDNSSPTGHTDTADHPLDAAAREAAAQTYRENVKDWAHNAPTDYKPFGDLEPDAFLDKYLLGVNGQGVPQWKWPPEINGFGEPPVPTVLQVGDVIERIGFIDDAKGQFATSPDTPMDKLTLPPDRLGPNYVRTRYEILKPLPPAVLEGRIAAGFEQPGGGLQYFFPDGVRQAALDGYLRELRG